MQIITVKVNRGPKELIQQELDAAEYARKMICRMWVTDFLPGHFQRGAHGKYNYESRSGKYLKRRGKRGKPDLVYTGRSRDRITSPAFRRFVNTRGFTEFKPVIGNDIRYFWMTPAGHPNKPAEMRRVIDTEIARMARAFRSFMSSYMAKESNAARPDYRF